MRPDFAQFEGQIEGQIAWSQTGANYMYTKLSELKSNLTDGRFYVAPNLHLLVRKTSRIWIFRYNDPISKTRKDKSLGSIDRVTPSEAKRTATVLRAEVLQRQIKANAIKLFNQEDQQAINLDKQINCADTKSPTYKDAIVSFMEIKSADLGEKKQLSWVNGLNTFLPKFGKKRLSTITTDMIVTELKKTWTKTTVGTKAKLDMLSRLFSWAIANGYHPGPNPAAWKENIEFKLPNPSKIHKVKNHPSLPYSQAPFFYAELSQLDTLGAKALQLLVLTGQRSGQIRTAKWSDIDLKNRTWSFQAENMKMSIPHVIPICDRLIDVLDTIDKTDSDYLFSTKGKALADVSVSKVIKDMNKKRVNSGRHEWVDPADNRPVNPHGFRTTLRVWGADKQHPKDAMEFQIAHKLKDKVEAAYNRSNLLEVRRGIMQQWSNHCLQNS